MGLFSRFKKSNKKSPVSTEEVEQETTDVTQEVAEQTTDPKADTLKANTLKFDAQDRRGGLCDTRSAHFAGGDRRP